MSDNRTGNAGGHGMTAHDIATEIYREEKKLLDSHSGIWFSCPKCSEEYQMSDKDYDLRDAGILRIYLSLKNKHTKCPLCDGWDAGIKKLRRQVDVYPISVPHIDGKTYEYKMVNIPQGRVKPKKAPTFAEQMARGRRINRQYMR